MASMGKHDEVRLPLIPSRVPPSFMPAGSVSVASDDIYDNAAANDDLYSIYSDDDGDYGALYTDDALYDEAGGKHFYFLVLTLVNFFLPKPPPPFQ